MIKGDVMRSVHTRTFSFIDRIPGVSIPISRLTIRVFGLSGFWNLNEATSTSAS